MPPLERFPPQHQLPIVAFRYRRPAAPPLMALSEKIDKERRLRRRCFDFEQKIFVPGELDHLKG